VRLSEWQVREQERARRVGIVVGSLMLSLGIVIGYTIGYAIGRFV
jgi:hypothetical protein